jgi:hypothetical protein
MGSRRALGILSLAAIAALMTTAGDGASAHAAAKRGFQANCRSGRTEFRKGALRVFNVSSRDPHSGGSRERLFVCTSVARKPRLIVDGGPDSEVLTRSFVLQGTRLGFEVQIVAFMGPVPVAPTEVGWIDVRRGPARLGLLNAGVESQVAEPSEPLLPVDKVHFAIAPDGSMAVIAGAQSGCQVVAVLTLPATRSTHLKEPEVLYTANNGGLDPASLTIDDTTVAWRTSSGSPASAPRSTGRPARGSPSAQTGGC